MRARLIPLDSGPAIELSKDMTLVGRNEDCDLRLDHKSVSKQHCVLVKSEGLILVRDLGSTNGTRVNGQRVRRAALLPKDNLAIANFKYQVVFGEESSRSKDADSGGTEDDRTERVGPPEVPQAIKVNALPDRYGE